ncbi:MAG: hypothetical protein IT370_34285 [Deltaproteobacteria bacterium]|nr:hypothetical protein [Deltaproteobacteria bacterium]
MSGLLGVTSAGCFARGGAGTRSNATAANLIILGAGIAMATAAALSDGDEGCGESNHPSGPCIDGTKLLIVPAVPLLVGGSLGMLYSRTGGDPGARKPRAPRRGTPQARARTLPGLTPSR